MRRSGARLLIAGVSITVSAFTLFCCSDFEGASSSSSSGALPDGTASEGGQLSDDASSPPVAIDDGGADAADGNDGAKRGTFRCESIRCSQERNEVCCIYRASGGALSGDCVIGNTASDCQPSGGESVEGISFCDDPTDCNPGEVCCHDFNGANPTTCGGGFRLGHCTTSANCGLCGTLNTGPSRIACDPTVDGQCPIGHRCGSAGSPGGNLVATSHCIAL